MKKKYKYNTLPKRDVFVDRLLENISQEHKDVVDLLIDCNSWYERNEKRVIVTPTQLQLITVYLHLRYSNLQTYVENEIDEFNKEVNRLDKGSHIVEEDQDERD